MSKQDSTASERLRQFVDECGSQRAAAGRLKCSPQFVGQVLSGQKRMPDGMLGKLGLRRTVIAAK